MTFKTHLCFAFLFLMSLFGCGGASQQSKDVDDGPSSSDEQTEQAVAQAPQPVVMDEKEVRRELREAVASYRYADAKDLLKRALLTDISDEFRFDAYYNLGVLSERSNDLSAALESFKKAAQLKPKSGSAGLAAARIMIRLGDQAGGVRYVRDRWSDNENASLRNAYNRLLAELGRESEAVIATSKAILREDENNADAMLNLAIVYQGQGKHDLVLEVIKRARADFKRVNPELMWRLARSQVALEAFQTARETLKEAVESGVTATPELLNMLGVLELRLNNYPEATKRFEEALKYSPKMVEACVNLSHAFKASKRYDEALSTLNRCADLAPDRHDMLYNLGILYLDGKFTKVKGVVQYERAKTYFADFLKQTTNTELSELAEKYRKNSEKRIQYEKKKAELRARNAKREAERKAREAEEQKKATQAKSDADGNDANDESTDESTDETDASEDQDLGAEDE